MSLTGKGLAEFGISKKGTPYFYGAKFHEGPLTHNKMNTMHRMYPKIVTTNYINKAIRQKQVGVVNSDCSSLISGYTNKIYGSANLYSIAKKRLPYKNYKDFAVGTVLYRQGHVGIFCGKDSDGNYYCMEAKGIDYGTVKTILTDSSNWKYGLTFDFMEYDYSVKVEGTSKGNNPYNVPTRTLKLKSTGNDVRWLQFELIEAGYGESFVYNGKKYSAVTIDGQFGNSTHAAVCAFQASSKIGVDGKVGTITRNMLINSTIKLNVSTTTSNPYKVPTRTLRKNHIGEDVKWLQYELIEAGYGNKFQYNGKWYSGVTIDGKFGNITYAAVCAFQSGTGLSVDGAAGKNTRTKLIAA